MNIQWFPGHMSRAMRSMRDSLSSADGVMIVLDARCPVSSFNPELKKLAGAKPVLYVLNKADLADGRADAILDRMKNMGAAAIKINSHNPSSKRDITGAIEKLTAEKRERALSRGQTRTFRFMAAGVPNTGKSALINALAGAKRAETGDKAGVTRGKQWISCGAFDIMDNPGTMPPSFLSGKHAARLAYVGSVNDDILDFGELALEFLAETFITYPERLKERYGIEGGEPVEMLNKACARRGFILRGGEFDYERGARAIIDDFRKGRLGKMTLDSPDDLNGIEL